MVDTLLLSEGLLWVVDGDSTQQVLKITVEGIYCCTGVELVRLFSALQNSSPALQEVQKEADKSRKEADERCREYVGTVI